MLRTILKGKFVLLTFLFSFLTFHYPHPQAITRQFIFVKEKSMKNYAQVYVENSFEAAAMYCKAFGAEITFEVKNDTETSYAHCELSVNGEGFLEPV